MVRMHLMRPQLWDRVKWPSIMGTGVLYLLLLSTCLGQDTEGKVRLFLYPLLPLLIYLLFSHSFCLCLVFSFCLHLFLFCLIIQSPFNSSQHDFSIRIVHMTSGFSSSVVSYGVSQHLSDLLLICVISVDD